MHILQELLLREHTQPTKQDVEKRLHLYELKRMQKKRPLSQQITQYLRQLNQLRHLRIQVSIDPPKPCLDCPVNA